MEFSRITAVDFDGCLCVDKYPEIGNPNMDAIEELKHRRAAGEKVILWTCREGQFLKAAVLWCLKHDLKFDAINNNLPETIDHFGNDCRKIYANEYWDDRAIFVKTGEQDNEQHGSN